MHDFQKTHCITLSLHEYQGGYEVVHKVMTDALMEKNIVISIKEG